MADLFEHREIGNQIADGDPGARFASSRLKNTKRKILYGETSMNDLRGMVGAIDLNRPKSVCLR